MKAAVLHATGEPPRFEQFPDPIAQENEAVVTVRAASLKPIDKQTANGSHYASLQELPVVCGSWMESVAWTMAAECPRPATAALWRDGGKTVVRKCNAFRCPIYRRRDARRVQSRAVGMGNVSMAGAVSSGGKWAESGTTGVTGNGDRDGKASRCGPSCGGRTKRRQLSKLHELRAAAVPVGHERARGPFWMRAERRCSCPGAATRRRWRWPAGCPGTFAGRERGSEFDTRHPVMTEDMIRQLPVAARRHRVRVHPAERAQPGDRPPARDLAGPAGQADGPAHAAACRADRGDSSTRPGPCLGTRAARVTRSGGDLCEPVPDSPISDRRSSDGVSAGRARRPWDQIGSRP